MKVITFIFGAALALIASTCIGVASGNNKKGIAVTDAASEEFQTWCIGKRLVDLPKGFEPRSEAHTFDGIKVEGLGRLSGAQLQGHINQRAAQLRAGKGKDGQPVQLAQLIEDPNLNGFVIAAKGEFTDGLGGDLEAYLRAGDFAYRLTTTYLTPELPQAMQALRGVAAAIQPLTTAPKPAANVSCMSSALVRYEMRGFEKHQMSFLMNGANGVGLFIAFEHAVDGKLKPETFGAGGGLSAKTVAGISGQQRIAQESGVSAQDQEYDFHFLGGSPAPAGQAATAISINLWKQDRSPDGFAYDGENALVLWESILGSVR